MDKWKVGVVGAGTIGRSVAQDLAYRGCSVILKDQTEAILDESKKAMARDHKFFQLCDPKLRSVKMEDILPRILFTTTYSGFGELDLVIENVVENFDVKKSVYHDLDQVCRDHTIYAVNTSCISITKIGSAVTHPQNVIGMHFMNPVPQVPLVELVKGYHTSKTTIQYVREFLSACEKKTVLVNDFPGFVTNRVLMLMINECIFLVQDQVAEPEEIDAIFKWGFSHKMGPLATADLIGLDTILQSLEVLWESYHDPKYRPSPYLKRLVYAGHLGRKTGQGFFKY